MKHVWVNKKTPKGEKPVREWIECANCGASSNGLNAFTELCKATPK